MVVHVAGVLADEIEINIGGTLYGGWTAASVTRSVGKMTGSFSVTLHDPMMLLFGSPLYTIFSSQAEPGADVEIYVAGEKWLTGKIDTRTANKSSDSHDVTVTGRGKSRDVVDSSHIDKTTQYNGKNTKQIIERVLKPFGIPLVYRAESPPVIPTYRYYMGDNAFDVASEVARFGGVTLTEDKNGKMVARDKDKGPAAGALIQGENILTYSVTKSDKDKHSKYEGKGQTNPDGKVRGKKANQSKVTVRDLGTKGHRPLIYTGESDIDSKKLKRRIEHEGARRAGYSLQGTCTVYGYRGSSGQLWEPDTLVPIYIPDEGIAEPLLIESVTFTKDQSGSIASIKWTRKQAYEGKASNGKGQGAKGKVAKGSKAPQIRLTPGTPSNL